MFQSLEAAQPRTTGISTCRPGEQFPVRNSSQSRSSVSSEGVRRFGFCLTRVSWEAKIPQGSHSQRTRTESVGKQTTECSACCGADRDWVNGGRGSHNDRVAAGPKRC